MRYRLFGVKYNERFGRLAVAPGGESGNIKLSAPEVGVANSRDHKELEKNTATANKSIK